MNARYPRIPAAVRAEMKAAGLRCPTATVAVLEDADPVRKETRRSFRSAILAQGGEARVVVRWNRTWHAGTCRCEDCRVIKTLLAGAAT